MSALTTHPPVRIPRALDRRPKWKGRYPIPYVMFVDDDGAPDFRINDADRVADTIRRRLCALCGTKLPPNWLALIGGPLCEANRLFMDGPMHEACARYAFTICPYLAAPHAHHASADAIAARHANTDAVVVVNEGAGAARPDRMALFLARGADRVTFRGHGYFRVADFARVEWYA
jgi:hypothetical protein